MSADHRQFTAHPSSKVYPMVEKGSGQGDGRKEGTQRPLRPLKAGLNQHLKLGLKFPCPVQRTQHTVRRPELRQIPGDLRQVSKGTAEVPLGLHCLSPTKVEPKSIVVFIMCFDSNILILKLCQFGALSSTIQSLWNAAMVRNNSWSMLVSGKHQMNEPAY